MKTIIYLTLFALLIAHQNTFANTHSEIKKIIQKYSPSTNDGLSVAIVSPDKVIFEDFFGHRDQEKKLPPDRNTIYGIGSCTKTFTALSTLLISEEYKIDLMTPIKNYWPKFELWSSEATNKTTLLDLITHSTGLPRYDALWYAKPFNRYEVASHLKFLKPKPEAFQKEFLYNNMTFTLAAIVGELLTSTSWENFVKNKIFTPLGIESSHFSPLNFSSDNHAQPYVGSDKIQIKDISNIGPAGSINSNLLDLEKWLQFIMNLKNGVSQSTIFVQHPEILFTPKRNIIGFNHKVDYSMGWFIEKYQDHILYRHQGNTDGFSCYLSFIPSINRGIIVLSNQHQDKSVDHIALKLYSMLLKKFPPSDREREAYLNWNHQNANLSKIQKQLTSYIFESQEIENSELVGTFFTPGIGKVKIKKNGVNQLILQYGSLTAILQKNYLTVNRTYTGTFYAYGKKQKIPVAFTKREGRVEVHITLEQSMGFSDFVKVL